MRQFIAARKGSYRRISMRIVSKSMRVRCVSCREPLSPSHASAFQRRFAEDISSTTYCVINSRSRASSSTVNAGPAISPSTFKRHLECIHSATPPPTSTNGVASQSKNVCG